MPIKESEDTMHISIATVHFVGYLLAWNCRHIANPEIQARIAEHFRPLGFFLAGPFYRIANHLVIPAWPLGRSAANFELTVQDG
ncbi:MAG: hypothetical protein V5B34_17760 [Accumulibacter sp.]